MRYFDDKEDIDLPFPKSKFKKYLKELSLKTDENIPYKQKRIIFLKTVKDFLSGKNSVDDLSSIAGYLENDEKDKTSDLVDILMNAEELAYYIRRDGDIKFYIEKVLKYYGKYKALID